MNISTKNICNNLYIFAKANSSKIKLEKLNNYLNYEKDCLYNITIFNYSL